MYMEESGDLRASSIETETREIMLKAVHHLETVSTYPVEKVWQYLYSFGLVSKLGFCTGNIVFLFIALQLNLVGCKSSFRIWRYWMTKEGADFARDITNREGRVNVWTEVPKMLIGCSTHTLPAMLKLLDEAVFPAENAEWAESTKNKLQDELMVRLLLQLKCYIKNGQKHYIIHHHLGLITD